MNKKTIIFLVIVVLLLFFGVYRSFFYKTKVNFTVAKVVRQNISQEISASGSVKQGDEINLAFKNSGRVEKIYVKVGDEIETDQDLVKLDTSDLIFQLKEAEANLQVAQAEATKSEQNLADAYQDALNALDDAYLKIYNAYTTISLLKRTYFERGDSESIIVSDKKYKIEQVLDQIKLFIDNAKKTLKYEDIDTALLKGGEIVLITRDAIGVIRNTIETSAYKDIVSSTDKTSLDTQKANMNTSYDNITNVQQNIALIKIDNAANINAAQSKSSENVSPIEEGQGGLYQAKIKQAQANIDLLENQIEESTLLSPTNGQITEVGIREGEITQSGQVVISMLPASPFQIKVDIYEEDIVKISIDNAVEISLTAFPNEIFKGKVISINPAEKIKEEVVYYETTIEFENPPEKVKPGMTADIIIKTLSKNNILVIPEIAIEQKDGKMIVQILKGKNFEEREIEIGLKGSDDMVEVISGLKEGEEVVIKK